MQVQYQPVSQATAQYLLCSFAKWGWKYCLHLFYLSAVSYSLIMSYQESTQALEVLEEKKKGKEKARQCEIKLYWRVGEL